MNKTWLIIQREYLTNVRKPAFLAAAFGMPVFIIGIMLFAAAMSLNSADMGDISQIGYVDLAGVMAAGIPNEDYPDLFSPYESEEAARAALDAGSVNGYFVLPEDYLQSAQVRLYGYESLPAELYDEISDLLIANLVTQVRTDIPAERLANPLEATIHIESSGRDLTPQSLPAIIIMPFIFVIVFMLSVQLTSSYVMAGLVEEKSNRLIEVLVTSVTPMQLLSGKLIGLGLLGITQIVVWLGLGLLALRFGQNLDFLDGLVIPTDLIVFSLIYFVLGFFLSASLLATVGVLVGSEMESRQYAAVLSILYVIPFYLSFAFLADSNGTVPTLLSLFPFTAPSAMIMRLGFISVPAWQIALSIGILLVTTVFLMWASARIFRWALLLYGKKFSLGMLLAVVRGRADAAVTPQQTTTPKKRAAA